MEEPQLLVLKASSAMGSTTTPSSSSSSSTYHLCCCEQHPHRHDICPIFYTSTRIRQIWKFTQIMRKSRHVWPSKISFSRVGYQWQILNKSKDINIFLFDPLPDIALHRYSKFLEGKLFPFSRVGLLPVAMTLPEE